MNTITKIITMMVCMFLFIHTVSASATIVTNDNAMDNGTLIQNFSIINDWTVSGISIGHVMQESQFVEQGVSALKMDSTNGVIITADSTFLTPINLSNFSNRSLHYRIYVYDLNPSTNISTAEIMLGNDTSYTKHVTAVVNGNQLQHGWNHILFINTSFIDSGITWDTMQIAKYRVSLQSTASHNATIAYDNMRIGWIPWTNTTENIYQTSIDNNTSWMKLVVGIIVLLGIIIIILDEMEKKHTLRSTITLILLFVTILYLVVVVLQLLI